MTIEFIEFGFPTEWLPVVRKASFNMLDDLNQSNPNKLFNDQGGLRKKMKLDIPALKIEEVRAWFE